ncbi:hypothetical protein [uncultured Jatrophihabitans sp.]|uniref:hypothetical protein n=1 Tax=uncultured Jatrophihabitans sp. TaxID=1610747 RepID=UPI0035CAB759
MIDTTGLSPASVMAIEAVERQLAAFEAADRAADEAAEKIQLRPAPTRPSKRQATGSSVVFTVRLDPTELTALNERAAARGLRPSVLARNLIRIGLAPPRDNDELARAVDRLREALVAVNDALGGQ